MIKYPFQRSVADEGVMLFDAILDKSISVRLAFDTGASHTTIDSNALLIAGYNLDTPLDKIEVETSNGIIEVDIFEVEIIEAFGLKKTKFPIQIYDFMAHGIVSEYEGVLGLDFLENIHFCVNLKKNEITIHS